MGMKVIKEIPNYYENDNAFVMILHKNQRVRCQGPAVRDQMSGARGQISGLSYQGPGFSGLSEALFCSRMSLASKRNSGKANSRLRQLFMPSLIFQNLSIRRG